MQNWIELSEAEYQKVWEKVYRMLNFEPSTTDFPAFRVPVPYITYKVSESVSAEEVDHTLHNLEEMVHRAFQGITEKDEYIYALDWEHAGYWMNPHLKARRNEWGEWLVPVYPDGDYYFFIQKDFKWGYLGHPWEKTITIFGERLLDSFEKNPTSMFKTVLRKS